MKLTRFRILQHSGILLAAGMLAPLARAGVIVVDAAGNGQYTQIQPAVDAALDGDTLLVKSGSYASFTVDDKSLSIVGDGATPITVLGVIVVKNLAALRSVVLAKLTATNLISGSPFPDQGTALLLRANQGSVRLQGCEFDGARGSSSDGKPGALVDGCSAGTAFVACTFKGGRGAGWGDPFFGDSDHGRNGGQGLLVQGSWVALYDCTLDGGRGGDAKYSAAGPGGYGVRVVLSNGIGALFASGSHVYGGRGGDSYEDTFNEFTFPGSGGSGVGVDAGTVAQILQSDVQGGPPGIGIYCIPTNPPSAGAQYSGSGQTYFFSVSRLVFHAPTPVRENTTFQAQVTGEPGARVFLMFSPDTTFLPFASLRGVVLVRNRHLHPELIAGTIPQSGALTLDLAAPVLAAGVQSTTFYIQASCIDSQGRHVLGSFAPIVVLDSIY